MSSFYMGYEVVLSDYLVATPRMQCSKEFCKIQSPALVASTNRWMLEFFGTERRMCIAGNKLFIHPDDWQNVQSAISRGDYTTPSVEFFYK